VKSDARRLHPGRTLNPSVPAASIPPRAKHLEKLSFRPHVSGDCKIAERVVMQK